MARRARMRRREFLKTTGLAAGVAATGLESIVAARRAPAHAQGTRLHILRWVDFIPEADVELKRQAPEASKALGAEVVFEFINFNDLQPRITAAVQSGAGADIIMMLYNWPHLYASALVRSEEHTSELQSRLHLVCRLLLEKKKKKKTRHTATYGDSTNR